MKSFVNYRLYNLKALKDVRFKPEHKKLEIDYDRNMIHQQFNQEQLEYIQNSQANTFTLTSNVSLLKTNCAIGVLRASKFYLKIE